MCYVGHDDGDDDDGQLFEGRITKQMHASRVHAKHKAECDHNNASSGLISYEQYTLGQKCAV